MTGGGSIVEIFRVDGVAIDPFLTKKSSIIRAALAFASFLLSEGAPMAGSCPSILHVPMKFLKGRKDIRPSLVVLPLAFSNDVVDSCFQALFNCMLVEYLNSVLRRDSKKVFGRRGKVLGTLICKVVFLSDRLLRLRLK